MICSCEFLQKVAGKVLSCWPACQIWAHHAHASDSGVLKKHLTRTEPNGMTWVATHHDMISNIDKEGIR